MDISSHNLMTALLRWYYYYPYDPSKDTPDYPLIQNNHANYWRWPQFQQPEIVDLLLKGKTNGFFFEAGAVDGTEITNTLALEVYRNWTGLLIEATPDMCPLLQKLNRKATRGCVGISFSDRIQRFKMAIKSAKEINSYVETDKDSDHRAVSVVDIVAFPLAPMIQAAGVTHVDYFSLDVEGAEPNILAVFPFDKITVTIFGVEATKEDAKAGVRAAMKGRPYIEFFYPARGIPWNNLSEDMFFIHKDACKELGYCLPDGKFNFPPLPGRTNDDGSHVPGFIPAEVYG